MGTFTTVQKWIAELFPEGRKLSVGGCALFQAANVHPYIGILRKVTQEKDTTKFTVNWLYRPADVKLAKGGPLEAAPNEIFYSFHKDEISAASLLHPCKVAFLRKGADLPQGVSSFVCRRVYDTANKCLWWLTDRDYTDEHQDEVDQLLERTKLEMQAVVQSGGPSPRAALTGGPTSSQQLKTGSDTVQNATYSASNKSKKRERGDQNLEPSKRERTAKSEDGELSPSKRERSMKPEEIASITDKDGGLLNQDGVKVLVQLMQQDRNDGVRKSTDVASRRTMLAGVVAATEREDCLSRFVGLGGLPMLDDWLQEAHKGKVGDGGSPKEGDKGVEELLLTLLKALDKLPVDLDALKTCSVGKSVNHLRSHKNVEIQKKARKLVDIWKKRVDAEIKLSGEVKPGGSNSNLWNNSYKQNSPDMHSHLMKSGGPTEVAVKSSGAFAGSAKAIPNGMNPGEVVSNGAPASAGGKIGTLLSSSSPSVVKREENGSIKLSNGTVPPDLPSSVKEERNTGPQQTQSNGQTWDSGSQGKSVAGSTWKEDVKNASMGGALSSKSLGTGSRHPSMNGKGLLGAAMSGSSKDLLNGKPLVWSRPSVTEKTSSSNPTPSEKGSADVARDSPISQHRLIVRIPNPGRSPARSSGATESVPGSRVMSPNVPERSLSGSVDASDGKGRGQNGNATVPEASADIKNGRLVSGVDEEREKLSTSVQSDGVAEAEKREESTRSELGRNVKESSEHNGANGGFTPRHGTSESAVGSEDGKKVEIGSGTKGPSSDAAGSEATAMDVDDLGISLLASVAASEIRRTGAGEITHERSQSEATKTELDTPTRVSSDTTASHSKEGFPSQQISKEGDSNEQMESKISQDVAVKGRDESSAMPVGDGNVGTQCGDTDLKKEGQQGRLCPVGESEGKDGEKRKFAVQDGGLMSEVSSNAGATKSPSDRKAEDGHGGETETESATSPAGSANPFSKDVKSSVNGSAEGSTVSHDGHNVSKNENLDERRIQGQAKGAELCNGYGSPASELKSTPTVGPGEGAPERTDRSSAVRSSGAGEGETDLSRCMGGAGDRIDRKVSISVAEAVEAAYDGAQELKRRAMDIRTLGRVPSFQSSPMLGLSNLASSTNLSAVLVKPAPRTLPAGEPTTPEQATETAGPSDGVVGGSDVSERPDFDLNEGFSVEESPQDDSTTSPVAPAPVVPASAPGLSSLLTAPIAIVTATKGGFVLPGSPMRTKSELGWKGSAATSAFRPAEPRRTPERQASAGDSLAPEASTGSTAKKGRPPLDLNIDLNVSDDRNFEDVGIAGAGAASSLSSQGSAIGMGTQVAPPSVSVSGITFQSDNASSGQLQQQCGNSSGGRPILDLNMLDESEESGTLVEADARVIQQVMAPSAKSNNSSSLQGARRASVVRDFDLNDGPMADEAVTDDQPVVQPLTSRNTGASMMPTGPAPGRGPEVVHSSWGFAPNGSFKPAIPGYSSRTEYPYSVAAAAAAQSYLSAGAGSAPFNSDMYRANVASVALSSAPPTAYPSGTQGPYHYGGFAVATGGSFTPSNVSPYLDSSGSVNFPVSTSGTGSSHLPRPPYLVGLSNVGPHDNGNSVWSARPSLDLNAGPEPTDGDGTREDLMNSRSAPLLGGPPSIDQMRVFRQVVNVAGPPVSAPPLKRKEPENGWDMNRSSGFKQQAWR